MNNGAMRWIKPGLSLAGALVLVGFLTMVLKPIQKDSAHVVAFINADGGRVMHAAELTLYEAFARNHTILITGKVAAPVRGDIEVAMNGEHPINYTVFSRNPPALPLLNQGRAWYRFEQNTFYNISPGDNLIFYVKVATPLQAGEYQVTLKDQSTGQQYLSVPVTFTDPDALKPAAPNGEDCH